MKKIILCSLVAMMAVTAANAEIASVEYVGNTAELKTEKKDDFTVAINELVDSVAKEEQDIGVGNDDNYVPTVARTQVMIDNSQTDLITDVTNLTTAVGENTDAIAANAQAIAGEVTAREQADKAISDKIGNVTEGKTVAEMIADAQTAATYDDTAVRGLISDEATAREQADTAISNKIGNVTENKTVVEMIGDAQDAAIEAAADDAEKIYQVKSDANYVVGMGDGTWKSLAEYYAGLPEYCSTGTCSLVSKEGVISWEKVAY